MKPGNPAAPVLLTVVLLGLPIVLGSCAREKTPPIERQFITPLPDRDSDRTSIEPLNSRLQPGGSSCEVLDALAKAPGQERYSFLAKADLQVSESGRIQGTGFLELEESPFVRLILAEKFKVPTADEFVEVAEKEHQAGRLTGVELFALKQMRWALPSKFKSTMMKKVSEKLEETFPGIFGSGSGLSKSMAIALLTKVNAGAGEPAGISRIVSTRLPLFAGADWKDFATDAERSLRGALTGIGSDEAHERACGLVLFQRSFAQLLAMKGYRSPVLAKAEAGPADRPRSKTRELSRFYTRLRTEDVAGAWVDTAQGWNQVLSSEAIANYQPEKKALSISVTPSDRSGSAGDFSSAVSMLEALTLHFEATSPAAPWFENGSYPLGDISNSKTALLPEDAHALALGMLGMAFKNVAALGIHRVNAQGAALQDGEQAAGIMFGALEPSRRGATVRLRDVTAFLRAVAGLETALKRFSSRTPEEWRETHSLYQPRFLAKLVGRAVFSEAELSSMLSDSERNGILLHSLESLHLPLALLLSKLSQGKTCVAEGKWIAGTGAFVAGSACSDELQAEVNDAKRILSRLTGSSIIAHPRAF